MRMRMMMPPLPRLPMNSDSDPCPDHASDPDPDPDNNIHHHRYGDSVFPIIFPREYYLETCSDGALFRRPISYPNFDIIFEGFFHDDDADDNDDTFTTVPNSDLIALPHYAVYAKTALKAYHDYFGTERQYEFTSFQKVVYMGIRGEYYLTFNITERDSQDFQAMKAIIRSFGPYVNELYNMAQMELKSGPNAVTQNEYILIELGRAQGPS